MNGQRRGTTWGGIALAGLLLLAASAVRAETAFQSWTAYEVREEIDCNPGGTTTPLGDPLCLAETTRGFGTRIADASLVGGLSGLPGGVSGGVFDPATGARLGGVSISASSIMSQVDWTGPAHGKFSLVTASGAVQRGTLSGQLNLSLLRFQNAPVAPISGHWRGTRGTLKAGGTFAGVFLLPFECQQIAAPACYAQLGPNGELVGEVAVPADAFVPGPGDIPIPLVQLQVTLFTD